MKKANYLPVLFVAVFLLLCACAQQQTSQAFSDPDALSSTPSSSASIPSSSVLTSSVPASSIPATSVPTTEPAPPTQPNLEWVVDGREIIPFEERFEEDVPFEVYSNSWFVQQEDNQYRKYSLAQLKNKAPLTVIYDGNAIYTLPSDRDLTNYSLKAADGQWAYFAGDNQLIRIDMLTGESTTLLEFSTELLKWYVWASGKDTACIYTLDQNYLLHYYYLDFHTGAKKDLYKATIPATPLDDITFYRPGSTQGEIQWVMMNPAFYEASLQSGLSDEQIQEHLNIPYWVRYRYNFLTGTFTEDFGIIDSCYTGTGQGHNHFDYDITKEDVPEILDVKPVEVPNFTKLTQDQADAALNAECTSWRFSDWLYSDFGHLQPYLEQDGVFTKIADIFVTDMVVAADYAYCITPEGTIVQLSLDGQICNTIYEFDAPSDFLFYWKGCLYFTDNSTIICIDTINGTQRPILRTTLKELYLSGEYMDGLYFGVRQGLYCQEYRFYPDTGVLEEESYI